MQLKRSATENKDYVHSLKFSVNAKLLLLSGSKGCTLGWMYSNVYLGLIEAFIYSHSWYGSDKTILSTQKVLNELWCAWTDRNTED